MVGQSENGKCGWTYNKKSKNKRHTSKHFANKKKICIYKIIYLVFTKSVDSNFRAF